jgi:hypothetical protein
MHAERHGRKRGRRVQLERFAIEAERFGVQMRPGRRQVRRVRQESAIRRVVRVERGVHAVDAHEATRLDGVPLHAAWAVDRLLVAELDRAARPQVADPLLRTVGLWADPNETRFRVHARRVGVVRLSRWVYRVSGGSGGSARDQGGDRCGRGRDRRRAVGRAGSREICAALRGLRGSLIQRASRPRASRLIFRE